MCLEVTGRYRHVNLPVTSVTPEQKHKVLYDTGTPDSARLRVVHNSGQPLAPVENPMRLIIQENAEDVRQA